MFPHCFVTLSISLRRCTSHNRPVNSSGQRHCHSSSLPSNVDSQFFLIASRLMQDDPFIHSKGQDESDVRLGNEGGALLCSSLKGTPVETTRSILVINMAHKKIALTVNRIIACVCIFSKSKQAEFRINDLSACHQ